MGVECGSSGVRSWNRKEIPSVVIVHCALHCATGEIPHIERAQAIIAPHGIYGTNMPISPFQSGKKQFHGLTGTRLPRIFADIITSHIIYFAPKISANKICENEVFSVISHRIRRSAHFFMPAHIGSSKANKRQIIEYQVLKTREKLIEIARQLFAHKGIENTTMNDIASASDKGRRTIYTYFRSKRDIYNAVVKTESDKIIDKLSAIVALPIDPEQKLMDFIFARFEAIKESVTRNGTLRAGFFRDVRKVDRARRSNTSSEANMLRQILLEGVNQGVFHIRHVEQTAMVMLLSLQGLDVPYIRDNFSELGIEKLKLREYIDDFIMNGIRNKSK